MSKRVIIYAHKPLAGDPRFPDNRPRGGETSVAIIRDYLAKFYRVPVITFGHELGGKPPPFVRGDVVLAWGRAVPAAWSACKDAMTPFIHMVRWWRNVCPLPPGNLMERKVDPAWVRAQQPLFSDAFGIITNNRYSAGVVERIYGVRPEVSYVPVIGGLRGSGNPDGPVVLVTDGKDLGAEELLCRLAPMMPKHRFMVVNAANPAVYAGIRNIETPGAGDRYVENMDTVWRQAGIVIYPAYRNDVCGTSRIAPEAMRWGVPCLANDRAGICEKGMIGISRDAEPKHWRNALEKVYKQYSSFSTRAINAFLEYDTPAQLAVFKHMVDRAFSSGA